MSPWLEPEQKLVQYLLGGLLPEEREQIEERLFHEDGLHQELLATADDLIHAYLGGELSPEDRARFAAHFLATPRRRERYDFMRGLVSAVERVSPKDDAVEQGLMPLATSRPWRFRALAASALAACVAAGVMLLPVFILFPRLFHRGTQPAVVVGTPSSAPTALAGTPTPVPGLRLEPGAPEESERVRAVSLPRQPPSHPVAVPLSAETRLVRLEVAVPEEGAMSYGAVLRSAAGREVWRADDLAPSAAGKPLVLEIPSGLFTGDDYGLVIRGETARGSPRPTAPPLQFALRVVRRR